MFSTRNEGVPLGQILLKIRAKNQTKLIITKYEKSTAQIAVPTN